MSLDIDNDCKAAILNATRSSYSSFCEAVEYEGACRLLYPILELPPQMDRIQVDYTSTFAHHQVQQIESH